MNIAKIILRQIKTIRFNPKTAFLLVILLLILGLGLNSAFIPNQLWAQPSQCNHDHHDENHENHPAEHKEHDPRHELEHDDHEHAPMIDASHANDQCDLEHNHAPGKTAAATVCSGEAVHMSPAETKQFGIVVEKAAAGHLDIKTRARGEVRLNRDRMAQIVPKVSGTVKEIYCTLGDSVEKGEIMAIIESQELADAKTGYLSALKHLELARTSFKREQKLRRRRINSEQEYLSAKKDLAEAEITLSSNQQRLIFLGLAPADLKQLSSDPMTMLTRLVVRSPFSGNVINKNIVLGEALDGTTPIFTVADLDSVWIDLDLYLDNAGKINQGDRVTIPIPGTEESIDAVIDYVAPLLDPQTRTTKARMIIDNHNRNLRPGSFITAEITTGKVEASIVVEENMIQDVDGHKCVFIKDEHGFESRPVTLGASDGNRVEITSGFHPGELIVTRNSFRLKAALETGVGSGCSSPGHVH
ncbi:MAG TPA: efflux RND transporter periplasmic adaptor subunit [Desulfarculaceae bacterium]|nr:efflux RND transporter periplasmic adaptor subunit [Desulfarculaceae bacterium]